MRLVVLLLGLASVASAVSFYNVVMEEWEAFKLTHNKKYGSVEEAFRLKVFAENKHKIAKHNQLYNKGERTFKMKINHFGDLLHHEFVSMMNGWRGNGMNRSTVYEASNYVEPDSDVKLPETVDWRTKGAVTPVKDQGQCGSCWAFSTHFRKTGQLVSLSEQNLVDCSGSFGNEGCNGGLMDNAFQYIKANGGIDTEDGYPYKGIDEKCEFSKSDIGADDTGFVDIRKDSEKALKAAVATVGPVSIAIDASQPSFQFYHSGVYNEPECSSENLDHGVLVVGYGAEDGQDFWIVKNSWSEKWGDEGYIYMARNANNMCGVASQASYPLV
ncbi:cathepsin L [Hyalella azteca]|uniref:Cathepsin L n=1 Tax=Hyalella azteca TaxID=294128 RepID=A0A6A0HCA4_HYAAZ|nr:cathepsin L [Hyalella azteca]